VDAAGEREVVGRGNAVDVERARAVVGLRVTVRGPDQGHHPLAHADGFPVDVHRFQRDPTGDLDRRVVAQRLLDRLGGHRRWVGAQSLPLFGVIEQRKDGVADQVDRGFEPRDEQEHAHRQDLVRPHLVGPGGDQAADDVVPGNPPPQVKELPEQPPQRGVAGLQPPRVAQRRDAVERGGDNRPVAGELARVRVGDTQQVGDNRDGQRRGKAGDQVELARHTGPVEEVTDRARYPVLVAGDRLRAERGQRQPAQPGVIRRVHLQEGQVELVRFGGGAGARGAHAEAPVTQHRVAYAMTRAHPVAQAGGDQRAPLADPVVDRVRIGPARAQPEQRHRIPLDVAGIGRVGALEVEAGSVRDGATGVVH